MSVTLKVGGSALSDEAAGCLTYAEYVESLDELDVVLIRLDLRAGVDVPTLLAALKVGKEFELTFPDDDATLTIKGDLLEVSSTWSRKGDWRIFLRGLEPMHKLRTDPAPAVYAVAANEIMSTVAGRYSLSAEASGVDGGPKATLQTGGDAAFVASLAEKLNYYVRADAVNKKLKFARRHVAGTAVELDFINMVEQVSMDVSLLEPVTKVTAFSEDFTKSTPEMIKYEATKTDLVNLSGGDDAATLAAPYKREITLPYQGTFEQSALKAYAVGEIQRRAEKLVRGRIRAEKAKGVLSGKLVKLTDAPWPLTGPFLVRQTRRVFDEGLFYVEIDFVSDSLPAAS